jgi:hypothetical protein
LQILGGGGRTPRTSPSKSASEKNVLQKNESNHSAAERWHQKDRKNAVFVLNAVDTSRDLIMKKVICLSVLALYYFFFIYYGLPGHLEPCAGQWNKHIPSGKTKNETEMSSLWWNECFRMFLTNSTIQNRRPILSKRTFSDVKNVMTMFDYFFYQKLCTIIYWIVIHVRVYMSHSRLLIYTPRPTARDFKS